jgi:outer membrane receptor protein involved in Fe transport
LLKNDSTDVTGTNSAHIPAQTFVDWTMAFRQAWRSSGTIEYRLGIKNLFDARPPIVVGTFGSGTQDFGLVNIYNYSPMGGYSPYGDALGRRFAMTISATF